jgi:hypothetical protein
VRCGILILNWESSHADCRHAAAGVLRRPAASSSLAKRSLAAIATIDAAANAADESGAVFANFQHR